MSLQQRFGAIPIRTESDLLSGGGCLQYTPVPIILLGLIINQIQLRNGLSTFQVQACTRVLLLSTVFLSLKYAKKSIPLHSPLQLGTGTTC